MNEIAKLAAKWRERAKAEAVRADRPHQDDATTNWHQGRDESFTDCADELEAAIAAAPTPPAEAQAVGGGEVSSLPERWRTVKRGLSAVGCANELQNALSAQPRPKTLTDEAIVAGWQAKANELDVLPDVDPDGLRAWQLRDCANELECRAEQQPRQGGGDAWPASVRDEALEVLRNVDAQLSATGQASARIERLINVLAGMNTTTPKQASAPVGVEAAEEMGALGGPASELERLAFEAWMRGHCWALCATWSGTGYRSDAEQGGYLDPRAMATRRMWAAWRDRAALAQQPAPVAPVGVEGLAEMWKREAAELVRNARDARARGAATVDDFARADRLDAKADGLHEAAADLLALAQQPAAVDAANIGRAFLTVLADPSVAWRDTGAQPFIDRVAALAQPQGASHEDA